MKESNKSDGTDEANWKQFEAEMREGLEDNIRDNIRAYAATMCANFELNLIKYKAAHFNHDELPRPEKAKGKKKKPPIMNIVSLFYDSDTMMPLHRQEDTVLGTFEEVVRLLASKFKDRVSSVAYRKQQQALFNLLKDKYGVQDKIILNSLIPDADKEERLKVYMRLKQGYRRKKQATQPTKKSNRSLPPARK